MGSTSEYSVPREAQTLFIEEILENSLMADLPQEARELGGSVRFEGSSKPSIPINWRFAESIAALKAFEATLLNILIKRKYGVFSKDIVINT